jgi:hypothetical protein
MLFRKLPHVCLAKAHATTLEKNARQSVLENRAHSLIGMQSLGPHEALIFFNKTQVLGIKSNSITMVGVLSTCAYLLALEKGKHIHGMKTLLVIPRLTIPMKSQHSSMKCRLC